MEKLDNHIQKRINSKWNGDLHVRPEDVKLPEENNKGKLLDIGLGHDFFGYDPKFQATKAKLNKSDYIQLKGFYVAKGTSNKMKRHLMEW